MLSTAGRIILGATTSQIGTSVLSGVAGIMLGGVGSYLIASQKEKRHMREVGALKREQLIPINNAFNNIIDSMTNSIDKSAKDSSLTELSNALNTILKEVCLPQLNEKNEFSHIPILNHSRLNELHNTHATALTDQIDEINQTFNAFYRVKNGGQMTRGLAIVHIWDNLFYVLEGMLIKASQTPGVEGRIMIDAIIDALANLCENSEINSELMQRTFNFLNWSMLRGYIPKRFKQNKEFLLNDLTQCQLGLAFAANAEHKKISVENTVIKLNAELWEEAKNFSSFFLNTLDDCMKEAPTHEIPSDTMLTKGECYKKTSANKLLSNSSLSNLIQHYAQNRAKILGISENQYSFNDLMNAGVFSIKQPKDIIINTPLDGLILNNKNKNSFENGDILLSVSQILNYLNIALALSEELRKEINVDGPRGLFAAGEMQIRLALINGVYQTALVHYKNLLKHEYFTGLNKIEKSTQFFGLFQHLGQTEGLTNKTKHKFSPDILEFIGFNKSDKTQIFKGSAIENTLEKMVGTDKNIKNLNKALNETLNEVSDQLDVKEPINKISGEFYYNLGILCAKDETLKNELESILINLKFNDQTMEKVNFEPIYLSLKENINCLIDINKVKNNIIDKINNFKNCLHWKDSIQTSSPKTIEYARYIIQSNTNLLNEIQTLILGMDNGLVGIHLLLNNLSPYIVKLKNAIQFLENQKTQDNQPTNYNILLSNGIESLTSILIKIECLNENSKKIKNNLENTIPQSRKQEIYQQLLEKKYEMHSKEQEQKIFEMEVLLNQTKSKLNGDYHIKLIESSEKLCELKENELTNQCIYVAKYEDGLIYRSNEIKDFNLNDESFHIKNQDIEKLSEINDNNLNLYQEKILDILSKRGHALHGIANKANFQQEQTTKIKIELNKFINDIIQDLSTRSINIKTKVNNWKQQIETIAKNNESIINQKNIQEFLKNDMDNFVKEEEESINQTIQKYKNRGDQYKEQFELLEENILKIRKEVKESIETIKILQKKITDLLEIQEKTKRITDQAIKLTRGISQSITVHSNKIQNQWRIFSYRDNKTSFLYDFIAKLLDNQNEMSDLINNKTFISSMEQNIELFNQSEIHKKTHFLSEKNRTQNKQDLYTVIQDITKNLNNNPDSLFKTLFSSKGLNYRETTYKIIKSKIQPEKNETAYELHMIRNGKIIQNTHSFYIKANNSNKLNFNTQKISLFQNKNPIVPNDKYQKNAILVN